jgi:hypothetical protein
LKIFQFLTKILPGCGLLTKYLTGEEVTDHSPDGGAELVGYYKNGKPKKLYGTLACPMAGMLLNPHLYYKCKENSV